MHTYWGPPLRTGRRHCGRSSVSATFSVCDYPDSLPSLVKDPEGDRVPRRSRVSLEIVTKLMTLRPFLVKELVSSSEGARVSFHPLILLCYRKFDHYCKFKT